MSSDAAEGPSKSRISSDVLSLTYRATKQLELTQQRINADKHALKPEHECVRSADVQREAPRQNKSIVAAHPAIYLNTLSHKLLRRAVRIWKMPVPMLNCTGSSKRKPRSFQEQLKRVEMLRSRSGASDARTRSVRDLQLGSGTDPSPSSSTSSEPGRRAAHNTSRRSREALRRHRRLSRRGEQGDGKLHRPREGQSSPAGSCWVKGWSESQGDEGDDPVIRAPERRTSRRSWRRNPGSSSSSETSPINPRPDTSKHTRVSEPKTSGCSRTEVDFLDNNSDLSKEASASEQKNVDDQDSSDVKLALQTREKLIPQTSLKTNMEEPNPSPQSDSEASQLKILTDDELKHCEDTHTHTPGPQSCVKWKSALLQRFSVGCEDQCPDERSAEDVESGSAGHWLRFIQQKRRSIRN
ncbi:hypothetical protein R3I94_020926 [Phoxinus phoxinus]